MTRNVVTDVTQQSICDQVLAFEHMHHRWPRADECGVDAMLPSKAALCRLFGTIAEAILIAAHQKCAGQEHAMAVASMNNTQKIAPLGDLPVVTSPERDMPGPAAPDVLEDAQQPQGCPTEWTREDILTAYGQFFQTQGRWPRHDDLIGDALLPHRKRVTQLFRTLVIARVEAEHWFKGDHSLLVARQAASVDDVPPVSVVMLRPPLRLCANPACNRRVTANRLYCSRSCTPPPRQLAPEQIEHVTAMIHAGASVRTIASALGVATGTVQSYRRRYLAAHPELRCPCGGLPDHQGWCSARVATSALRQRFLASAPAFGGRTMRKGIAQDDPTVTLQATESVRGGARCEGEKASNALLTYRTPELTFDEHVAAKSEALEDEMLALEQQIEELEARLRKRKGQYIALCNYQDPDECGIAQDVHGLIAHMRVEPGEGS